MPELVNNYLEYILIFIGIMLGTILVGTLVNVLLRRFIRRAHQSSQIDPTNYQFLRRAITALIYIVGFSSAIYLLPNLRALAGSLLAGAGILAVAVGFASQHALSNIISGLFIVIFKPFRVNDLIQLRSLEGYIEDITLRHVVIRDYSNQRIIIPNAIISDEFIINSDFTDRRVCKRIDIPVPVDVDIDVVKEVLRQEILGHHLLIDHRTKEDIERGAILGQVRINKILPYALNLRGWAWVANATDGFILESDVLEAVVRKLNNAGIKIPVQMDTLQNEAP